ncbi:MAG TPA: hypothetical protein DEB09_03635 [Candidatus Magasanikbacteria bacterium]|nr:hypothetical protein [Candidatus Magasanikbacteria bacterium]
MRQFMTPWEKENPVDDTADDLIVESTSTELGNLELSEGPKTVEKVKEKARGERLRLLRKIFLDRIMQLVKAPLFLKLINNAPFYGEYNLAKGTITEKEGGRDLEVTEQFNYMVATTAAIFAYAAAYVGEYAAAGVGGTVSYYMANFDALPMALDKVSAVLKDKMPKLSSILKTVGDFISVNYEKLIVAKPYRKLSGKEELA